MGNRPDLDDYLERYLERIYRFDNDPEGEFICDLIAEHSVGQTILDLGCGPVHHRVLPFLPLDSCTVAVDWHPDVVAHLRRILEQGLVTDAELRGLRYRLSKLGVLGTSDQELTSQIRHSYRRCIETSVHDAREFNPAFAGRFSTILQLGCFLCFSDESELRQAVQHAHSYLMPGGIILNVNYLEQLPNTDSFIGFSGPLSSTLRYEEYLQLLQSSGLNLLDSGRFNRIDEGSVECGVTEIVWAKLQA